MKKVFWLTVATLLAGCSPPPEAYHPPVDTIRRSVVNQDGPWPARIFIKITYQRNYDQALYGGYATGTVSQNGNSWTNRSYTSPAYNRAFVCPELWVYLGKPIPGSSGYSTIVDVSALAPYTTHIGRGDWGEASSGQTIEQVLDCSYKVDGIGINRTQNVDYKLWVGLDCTRNGFGGYLPGHPSDLASAIDYWSWDIPIVDQGGGKGPVYEIYQGGPGVYGAHSLWEQVSLSCGNTSRRIPNGGTLPNVVICGYISQPGGFCVGWLNLGGLVW